MKLFKDYLLIKETSISNEVPKIMLPKGFVPPLKLRPVIEAFNKSNKIVLMGDLDKPLKMPNKKLYLVGGPVRDFIHGKTIKDYDLATDATPEQIGIILAAAGFKKANDKDDLNLPTYVHYEGEEEDKKKIADVGGDGRKAWYVKGTDENGKAFVVGAVVNGEEFDIATLRKDAKVTDGKAKSQKIDFVSDIGEDASRRDFTINSLYIELNKTDGENKVLYDPTGNGLSDLKNQVVKTVGKAEDRFNEDKLRVMRAIRFHCRFGKGAKLDPDIEKALPKFANLDGVALERVRDEFIKGLTHPDVDVKCYLNIYKRTGLLHKVFPGIVLESPGGIPLEFTDKKDKILALAWLLQHNPTEKVEQLLSPTRETQDGEVINTGWQNQEKKAVIFLLKLKEFQPQNVYHMNKSMASTGLTAQQIKDWVDMFKVKAGEHGMRDARPQWSRSIRAFADFRPNVKFQDLLDSGFDINSPDHMRQIGIADLVSKQFLKNIE